MVCGNCGSIEIRHTVGGEYECLSCGRRWIDTKSNSEFNYRINNASELLRCCMFEEAREKFESLAGDYPNSHEAIWGIILAKNGICYVNDDLIANKKVPTCNITNDTSLLTDPLYDKLIDFSQGKIKQYYIQEISKIENIRLEILNISSREKPYDVFICYKKTDENKQETPDCQEARKMYTRLRDKGYKVFFAEETLREHAGKEYEPFIYNAINTAKAMIVYGEKLEYFNAVWVKNEWIRYIKKIESNQKQADSLIPCYKNIQPDDLPAPLAKRQALNAVDNDFYENLFNKIESLVKRAEQSVKIEKIKIKSGQVSKKKATADVSEVVIKEIGNYKVAQVNTEDPKTLLRNAKKFFDNGMSDDAYTIYNTVLDKNPDNAEALYGIFLIDVGAKSSQDLANNASKLDSFDEINEIISKADKLLAQEIIISFLNNINSMSPDDQVRVFKNFIVYNFDGRSDIINKAFAYCKNNEQAHNNLLDAVLTTVDIKNVDEHIRLMLIYGESRQNFGDFDNALIYYDRVLNLENGNSRALLNKFKAENLIKETAEFKRNAFVNFVQFETFIKYLKYTNEAQGQKTIKECIDCLLITDVSQENIERVDAAFKRFLSVYKGNATVYIEQFADKMMYARLFSQAEYYYAVLTNINKSARIYWQLLKAKLSCVTNDELVNLTLPIKEISEYKSAISCEDADDDFVDEAILVCKKQQENLQKKEQEAGLLKQQQAERERIERERLRQQKVSESQEKSKRAKILRKEKAKKRAEKRNRGLWKTLSAIIGFCLTPFIWLFDFFRHLTWRKVKAIINGALACSALVIGITFSFLYGFGIFAAPLYLKVITPLLCLLIATYLISKWHYYELGDIALWKTIVLFLLICVTMFFVAAFHVNFYSNHIRYIKTHDGYSVTAVYQESNDVSYHMANLVLPSTYKGEAVVEADLTIYSQRDIDTIYFGLGANKKAYNRIKKVKFNSTIETNAFYKINVRSIVFNKDILMVDSYAFGNGLTQVHFKGDIDSIRQSAFANCTSLREVKFDKKVGKINASAFYNCPLLSNVQFRGRVGTIATRAFYNCGNLKDIEFGDDVMRLESYAFDNCGRLQSGNKITFKGDVGTLCNYALNDCSNYEQLNFKGKVESIGVLNLNNLRVITFEGDVNTINSQAFSGLDKLKEVLFYGKVEKICQKAFYSCDSLEEIKFSGEVDSIFEYAFAKCDKLEDIYFASKVNYIGNYAFAYCAQLDDVVFNDEVGNISNTAFEGCNNATIYKQGIIQNIVRGEYNWQYDRQYSKK